MLVVTRSVKTACVLLQIKPEKAKQEWPSTTTTFKIKQANAVIKMTKPEFFHYKAMHSSQGCS